jgi:hypothetical protein
LQGKENIQDISNKISAAKAKIEEINLTKPISQSSQGENSFTSTVTGNQNSGSLVARAVSQSNAVPDATGQSGFGTVGTLINVSA